MNNRKLIVGLMTGLVVSLFIMVPVSATTTVIDFEWDYQNGIYLSCEEKIYQSYLYAYGVEFKEASSGATSLENTCSTYNSNFPTHSGSFLFYNPDSDETRIDFESPVSKVGIWYTAYNIIGTNDATLEAYDSDDHLIGSVSGDGNTGYQDDGYTPIIPRTDHLVVQGSIENPNIKYIILRGTIKMITYDDLEFDTAETVIPEFPNMAIPVISVIGLIFLMGNRRRSE